MMLTDKRKPPEASLTVTVGNLKSKIKNPKLNLAPQGMPVAEERKETIR